MTTPASPSFKIVGGDGKEYGPIDLGTLQEWARENRLAGTTQVWDSRTGQWQPASQIAELAGLFSKPAPSAGPAAVPPAAPAVETAPAPGVELAARILARGYTVEFGRWIGDGWAFFKANLGLAMGACWIVFGLSLVASVIGVIPCLGDLVRLAFTVVVQPVLIGGLWLVLLQCRRGQPVTAANVFDGFKLFFAQGILVNLIMMLIILAAILPGGIGIGIGVAVLKSSASMKALGALLIAAGTLVALIPVIYFSVCYAFALPLVADRRMQFWAAMETSRRVINRHWFAFFVFSLAVGLLVLLGALACGVGLIFTIPLGFCISVIAYEAIFGSPTGAGTLNP